MADCAQGRKVRFFRITELITLLLEGKEERQLMRLRRQLGKLNLLILDELASSRWRFNDEKTIALAERAMVFE
jgi:DNA replication protein DnaC